MRLSDHMFKVKVQLLLSLRMKPRDEDRENRNPITKVIKSFRSISRLVQSITVITVFKEWASGLQFFEREKLFWRSGRVGWRSLNVKRSI